MLQIQEPHQSNVFSLFNLGFRPFFFLGALVAGVLMLVWLHFLSGSTYTTYYQQSVLWHSHEMLFGFTIAIITGFLLTAVKNWTNIQTPHGLPLLCLTLLWLSARVLPFFPALPAALIAMVDLVFIPAIAMSLAIPLIKNRNYKNLVFIPILLGFFAGNLLIHAQVLGLTAASAYIGIKLSLCLVILMITIIGGRVIPFFTERGLKGVECSRYKSLEITIILLSILWVAIMLSPLNWGVLLVSSLLAFLHSIRLYGWFSGKVLKKPMLWILHLSYAFLPLGFALLSLSTLGYVSYSSAIHVFTVGVIGGLTIGMMPRITLGHTGRPIKSNHLTVLLFMLMVSAAVIRLGAYWLINDYLDGLYWSGLFWVSAWFLFCLGFGKILIKPRIDDTYG